MRGVRGRLFRAFITIMMRTSEPSTHTTKRPATRTFATREMLDAISTFVTLVARSTGVPSIGTRHVMTPSADWPVVVFTFPGKATLNVIPTASPRSSPAACTSAAYGAAPRSFKSACQRIRTVGVFAGASDDHFVQWSAGTTDLS